MEHTFDDAMLQGRAPDVLAKVLARLDDPAGHEFDHAMSWSRGGVTEPANAVPLCDWHNRWKHDHRHLVRRDPSGRLCILRPDGSPLDSGI